MITAPECNGLLLKRITSWVINVKPRPGKYERCVALAFLYKLPFLHNPVVGFGSSSHTFNLYRFECSRQKGFQKFQTGSAVLRVKDISFQLAIMWYQRWLHLRTFCPKRKDKRFPCVYPIIYTCTFPNSSCGNKEMNPHAITFYWHYRRYHSRRTQCFVVFLNATAKGRDFHWAKCVAFLPSGRFENISDVAYTKQLHGNL